MYKWSGNEQKVEQKLKTLTVMKCREIQKKLVDMNQKTKKSLRKFRNNNEIVVKLLSIEKMLWK